jgi:hypothetical protein
MANIYKNPVIGLENSTPSSECRTGCEKEEVNTQLYS